MQFQSLFCKIQIINPHRDEVSGAKDSKWKASSFVLAVHAMVNADTCNRDRECSSPKKVNHRTYPWATSKIFHLEICWAFHTVFWQYSIACFFGCVPCSVCFFYVLILMLICLLVILSVFSLHSVTVFSARQSGAFNILSLFSLIYTYKLANTFSLI